MGTIAERSRLDRTPDANGARDSRDDAALLAAIAQARDQDAFNELIRRLERPAYAVAFHISGRKDLAEEAVQDAMLRVWKSAAKFRAEGPVKAWVLRIVARESLQLVRAQKRKSAAMDVSSLPPSEDPSPVASAESSELTDALRREFRRLPDLERQIVGLRFGGGLTQDEISEMLSIPQQTVSFRINETLKRLRANLGAAGFAAALPLSGTAAARILGDALTSGIPTPPGLRLRITQQCLKQVSLRSRRVPRSTAASSHLSLGVTAAGVLSVTLAAALCLIPSTPPPGKVAAAVPATVAPVLPVATVAPAAPVASVPVPQGDLVPGWSRTWTFESLPVPNDLEIDTDWKLNRERKSIDVGPIGMGYVLPHYYLPRHAVQLTWTGIAAKPGQPIGGTAVVYNQLEQQISRVRGWAKPIVLDAPAVTSDLYFYNRRLVAVINGQVNSVGEYGVNLEDKLILFQFNNASLKSLTLRVLRDNEIPTFVKNSDVLIQDMQPLSSR